MKYYDLIQVKTVGSVTADFSYGLFRVGGTLHVNVENLHREGYPVFTLKADYIQ